MVCSENSINWSWTQVQTDPDPLGSWFYTLVDLEESFLKTLLRCFLLLYFPAEGFSFFFNGVMSEPDLIRTSEPVIINCWGFPSTYEH